MRRIVTAITAAAMALSLVSMAMPANAVAGYDSAYAGESAFLTLNPGQSGSFTVFFQNTGTTAWTRGTSSQVDLAACQENKTTCNAQDASEAPFNSGWLSTTRYATHTQTTVAPGSIGTFTYNVAVPAGQAAGTYRFNGALVLSSTGEDIRNEGYYQDVTVPTAVGSCTPTAITTTPTTAQNQVGVTHTQSATVTCATPTGATTAPPSVGTQVTFIVDAAATDTGNADVTLTATTDANGLAQVTWTRSNPGTDTVAVYPTSTPAVRATATKRWVAGAFTLACEPTAAATLLSGSNRNFTITVRNPTTGALVNGAAVDITTTANLPATTWQNPTTVAGVNAIAIGANNTIATVNTGASGTAVVSLTGTLAANVTTGAITVRAFLENDPATFGGTTNNTLDANEFRVDCGTTTFETLRAATIAVTPDTTATNAVNGNRVYTVTATDQFGAAFANNDGRLRFSLSEFISGVGTTARRNTNFSADGIQEAGTAPTARTDCSALAAGDQNFALTASTSGVWYVMICASAATTGTPMSWYDADNNQFPTTGEVQDTGGAKTWAAAAVTSAALTPSSATNAASSEEPVTNNNSNGEEKYTSRLVDQSGNTFAPTAAGGADVTFTVRNTSSTGNIGITFCGLTANDAAGTTADPSGGAAAVNIIAPNATATCVLNIPQNSLARAQVEIDRGNGAAGTATVDVSIVHAGVNYVGTQATKTWVAQGTADVGRGDNAITATGNVVAFDTTLDYYTVSTTAGNFTINYTATDTFTVDGSTASIATFETNLTVGDRIVFTDTPGAGVSHHALTNQ